MPKYNVTKNMGAALKNLRQQRNVKAITLAKTINKTGAYISKLEKGELNTIDCENFIDIIRAMSNNEAEFAEAIDTLLKDTSMQFSEEEEKDEEWKLNLDYFIRALPVKDEYKALVISKMNILQISSIELSNYINQNSDIYNSNEFSKEDLDKTPRNRWIFNGGNSYVLMEIPSNRIDDILTTNTTSCYGELFCILMSLYRLEKIDKNTAYKKAYDDLESMQILMIRDMEAIMQAYDEERQLHDLLSQRNNPNLPEENRQLLNSLNSFTQEVYSFSIIDINYVNEKISNINQLFETDRVLALKLLGTDISPLKDKPTQIKKDFFSALDNLIQEYSIKELSKKDIELL